MKSGYRPVNATADGDARAKTDLHCHECGKGFIAELDYAINGNHIIECPRCGHEHCRVITDGKITAERWDTRAQRVNVEQRCVWKSDVVQAQTSVAATYIRDLWLNRSDVQL